MLRSFLSSASSRPTSIAHGAGDYDDDDDLSIIDHGPSIVSNSNEAPFTTNPIVIVDGSLTYDNVNQSHATDDGASDPRLSAPPLQDEDMNGHAAKPKLHDGTGFDDDLMIAAVVEGRYRTDGDDDDNMNENVKSLDALLENLNEIAKDLDDSSSSKGDSAGDGNHDDENENMIGTEENASTESRLPVEARVPSEDEAKIAAVTSEDDDATDDGINGISINSKLPEDKKPDGNAIAQASGSSVTKLETEKQPGTNLSGNSGSGKNDDAKHSDEGKRQPTFGLWKLVLLGMGMVAVNHMYAIVVVPFTSNKPSAPASDDIILVDVFDVPNSDGWEVKLGTTKTATPLASGTFSNGDAARPDSTAQDFHREKDQGVLGEASMNATSSSPSTRPPPSSPYHRDLVMRPYATAITLMLLSYLLSCRSKHTAAPSQLDDEDMDQDDFDYEQELLNYEQAFPDSPSSSLSSSPWMPHSKMESDASEWDLGVYEDLKVAELRSILKGRGCCAVGRKHILVDRLVKVYTTELTTMRVKDLRPLLKRKGCKQSGRKVELVQRLVEAGL